MKQWRIVFLNYRTLGFFKRREGWPQILNHHFRRTAKKRSSSNPARSFASRGRSRHYQIWKHLSRMIKDGQQNAFISEYGNNIFEYSGKNSEYSKVLNDAMSSYSAMHTAMVLEALSGYDFSNVSHICEIGGGQGHLLSHLQSKYNHLIGTILELESVVNNQDSSWPNKMGLQIRLQIC